jgi:hypothetical protein
MKSVMSSWQELYQYRALMQTSVMQGLKARYRGLEAESLAGRDVGSYADRSAGACLHPPSANDQAEGGLTV